MDRGFHLPNRRVNGFVGPTEQRCDLVDTEQRIGVERECEKYLAAGEVLLVKGCSVGVDRLEIAVTAPNAVEMRPRLNGVVPAPWTGRILPEFLESPLDARMERLGVDIDDAQLVADGGCSSYEGTVKGLLGENAFANFLQMDLTLTYVLIYLVNLTCTEQ